MERGEFVQMKNYWKQGFFVLLGVDLLIILFLFILLIIPANNSEKFNQNGKAGDYASFLIQSNKEDLNKLINQYLKRETKNSPIAYQVHLGNEVELYGTIPFFSENFNMKLSFEPEALQNGDLVLRQKTISIGSIYLPVDYVLKFISDNYKLPSGVTIQPNHQLIYIDMKRLKLTSNMMIKVNKFDLKKNVIVFTLLVPIK